MTASPESRESLCTALGRTVDRMVKRHPDLTIPDICAALGLAAGAVVGVGIPPGETEADLTLGNIIGTGYAHGVAAVRQQRAS